MKKIVVLDGYTLNPGDLTWAELEKLGELEVYDRTPVEEIAERCRGAEMVFTNKAPLRRETLARLPDLRYVGVLATGYDQVDVACAAELGITVTNVPSYGTESVAQFVFALLLELCHRVGEHGESVRGGDWARSPDFCYWRSPLTELSGKTMGIVGMGRIGEKVAELAKAFGMNVVASGRAGRKEPAEGTSGRENERDGKDGGVPRVELEELLRRSDVVSLHCPLTPETEGLIRQETIGRMKPGAMLVNTARGKLIAEADLAAALNEGRLAGAALDVLSAEPPSPGNPLLSARNCIITPHIAWASFEARRRLLGTAIDNAARFLSGSPVNVVGGKR
ncbi:D-2-hydroxyacid dehydrogenase [Cohnella zeiphila]|uniref:D-2-hydroxyacid dehydrogenase n=1 Tax=Cohnella zeiphila TaxID=2761120 RepID=A0A7X0SLL8_9BACL|nr:D-2-hydroxyacid dehydrogenase [Cohnella zeiphila]MBB6729993.1 D-2-hydroxyacid dehydrogenase [Cohnella zeiphila]